MDAPSLRHTLATLAYRAAKVLRGVPDGFSDFQACENARTPGQILAHLGDLMDWALTLARGEHKWQDSAPLPWDAGSQRFFRSLAAFDAYLAAGEPLLQAADLLFQGPVADALTHVGQIAFLRRMYGTPIRAENYFRAPISTGQVGYEQKPPVREF